MGNIDNGVGLSPSPWLPGSSPVQMSSARLLPATPSLEFSLPSELTNFTIPSPVYAVSPSVTGMPVSAQDRTPGLVAPVNPPKTSSLNDFFVAEYAQPPTPVSAAPPSAAPPPSAGPLPQSAALKTSPRAVAAAANQANLAAAAAAHSQKALFVAAPAAAAQTAQHQHPPAALPPKFVRPRPKPSSQPLHLPSISLPGARDFIADPAFAAAAAAAAAGARPDAYGAAAETKPLSPESNAVAVCKKKAAEEGERFAKKRKLQMDAENTNNAKKLKMEEKPPEQMTKEELKKKSYAHRLYLNRQSAAVSRVRRQAYVRLLEESLNNIEQEKYKHQNQVGGLQEENSKLRSQIQQLQMQLSAKQQLPQAYSYDVSGQRNSRYNALRGS